MVTIVLAFPMALLWMIFSAQFTVESFVIGYIFGFAIMLLVQINTSFESDKPIIRLHRLPSQLVALIIYIIKLSIDVILSGFDVAVRVIQPKMPIAPGFREISTQDKSNTALVSALSAHSITITPGEFVIDFGEDATGQTTMLVHTLDKHQSTVEKLDADQARRLDLIYRILGQDREADGGQDGR